MHPLHPTPPPDKAKHPATSTVVATSELIFDPTVAELSQVDRLAGLVL
jgi:hypothetical protein